MRRSRLRLVLLLLAAVAATLVATALARPGDPHVFPPKAGEPRVAVFLSHNGYHTELALPTAFVRRRGGVTAEALDRLDPAPWVLVGWGDARFYMQTGRSFERVADGLRALWPDNPSVLRLTPLNRDPDRAFEHGVLRLELSEVGAERLLRRVDRSFRTAGGHPLPVPARQADGSAIYFRSVERFSMAKLCNNWTGEVVNAAGVPTMPALHVLPQGLMWDVGRRTDARPAPLEQ